MTITQAIQHLEKGGKITNAEWQEWKGCYLCLIKGCLALLSGPDAMQSARSVCPVMGYRLTLYEVRSDKWEVVKST